MSRYEIELLVETARDTFHSKQAALRVNDLNSIIKTSRAYREACDELQKATKWSLTKMFAVVNEGKDF